MATLKESFIFEGPYRAIILPKGTSIEIHGESDGKILATIQGTNQVIKITAELLSE